MLNPDDCFLSFEIENFFVNVLTKEAIDTIEKKLKDNEELHIATIECYNTVLECCILHS